MKEESRDGQSTEVLRNQNMLHIMNENEKYLSYSLEVNQSVHGFDAERV